MDPVSTAAQHILATLEASYQPTHDYVAVETRAFRHLDLRFYERTATMLGAKGFRVVADIEDRTISNTPRTVLDRIMIRMLLSKDGTVTASLYDPRIKSFWKRLTLRLLRALPGKVVDMETEFSDGSFVVTSNAASAAAIRLPSLIDAEYHPCATTVHEIHARHTARVAGRLQHSSGVFARQCTGFAEMVASQNRMNALKAAFRGEIGGITKDELEQLSRTGPGIAHAVHDAIRVEQSRRAG